MTVIWHTVFHRNPTAGINIGFWWSDIIGNFKDPTVGSVSDSKSRKPTGFGRLVGSYKIRSDPVSNWRTWEDDKKIFIQTVIKKLSIHIRTATRNQSHFMESNPSSNGDLTQNHEQIIYVNNQVKCSFIYIFINNIERVLIYFIVVKWLWNITKWSKKSSLFPIICEIYSWNRTHIYTIHHESPWFSQESKKNACKYNNNNFSWWVKISEKTFFPN
jgi:hypothetical protein